MDEFAQDLIPKHYRASLPHRVVRMIRMSIFGKVKVLKCKFFRIIEHFGSLSYPVLCRHSCCGGGINN